MAQVANAYSLNANHPLHRKTSLGLQYLGLKRAVSGLTGKAVYRFGQEPAAQGSGGESLLSWLQGDTADPLQDYDFFTDYPSQPNWFIWKRPDTVSGSLPSYMKIYVSPTCDDLPDVFRKTAQLSADLQVPCLKVVACAQGLGRSDKLVLYLESADVGSVTAELATALSGYADLGVPFTLPVSDSCMLSVAADPKEIAPYQTAYRHHSWRTLLAKYLASGRQAGITSATAFWRHLGLPLLGTA